MADDEKGALDTPFPDVPITFLDTPETIRKKHGERVALEFKKVLALLKRYNIEIGDNPLRAFYMLSLALAYEHEPSFKVEKNKGRYQKWHVLVKAIFVLHFEFIKKQSGSNNTGVAIELSDIEPWKSFVDSDGRSSRYETIRKKYQSFKKDSQVISFTNHMRPAYQNIDEDQLEGIVTIVNTFVKKE